MLYSQALSAGIQAQAPSAPPSSSPRTTATGTPEGTEQSQPQSKPTTNRHPRPRPRQKHHPNPYHRPNTTAATTATAQEEETVYVLTLTTTPSLTQPLTALRRSHFPRHLDHHPAHLTLFHALPGSEMPLITAALAELCAAQGPLALATGAAFRMRRGVGINVADGQGQGQGQGEEGGSQAARRLHGELQRRWWGMLSAQDRRPAWRPHWTVQNKAAGEGAVDAALEQVRMGFRGAEGLATGCALWRYEKGGRWTFERGFDFNGNKQVAR